ncbi:MAG: UDP-N-acetylglucosamine 1-carboxyvinyltransferase [Anaerolineaceae bacterium]|nr:UDP-N-acetylglucosamine 1-carboxyvinyltransferase [Anaerolineaceae bacterium]
MQQFIIEGGHTLTGELTASGNKNAALKMLPACLLTEEPVTLTNLPDIGDVRVTIQILEKLGATTEWVAPKTLRVHAQNISTGAIDPQLGHKTRASVVFSGPLLARLGRVELPIPGGDSIGERRVDTLTSALEQLGGKLEFRQNALEITAKRLTGANILLQEASVTATENTIMAAVLAKGTTVIRNTASEPHVQDLCHMLMAMGAQIEGVGTNQLTITGVERLGGCEARVGADYMEVGSLIGAAVMTGGALTIKEADPQHLDMIALMLGKLGVRWQVTGADIVVPAGQSLTVSRDLGNRIPTIKTQPWPAFPPDLMSIALVIATQSAGTVMFHDWMYESRFFFTDKLVRMGANITLCDPHRVLVQGPTPLHGLPYITSPDIRAGMAMLLAALAAKGQTHIFNIQQIDRGYERIDEKLNTLGASIQRVDADAVSTGEVQLVNEASQR